MTLPDDTEPSAEALEAAVDFLWPHYCDDKLPKMKFAESEMRCQNLALVLDRFRAAGVEAERQRCATIADADAQAGLDDMHDRTLDKAMVGSRILAAARIAQLIRSGETP